MLEIAEAFLEQFSKEENKAFSALSDEAAALLLEHSWPGNVRELQNIIRNAVILNDGPQIERNMLSIRRDAGPRMALANRSISAHSGAAVVSVELGRDYGMIERDVIEAAIRHCGGSIPKAANMLNVSASTIYRKRDAWNRCQPDASEPGSMALN